MIPLRWTFALVLLAAGGVALGAGGAAPRTPDMTKYSQPYHVQLPRAEMLAAWARLRQLEIPGVPNDPRFDLKGQSFYVGPEGDDANDGAREHPWKTLAFGVNRLKPGTILVLLPGVYYGPVTISLKATEEAPAAVRALEAGTVWVTYSDEWVAAEAARITRGSDERHQAVYADGKAAHYPPLFNITGTYIEVSGLHLLGVRDLLAHNLYSECGVLFTGGGGMGCRVVNNEIENVGHCGVKEQGHGGKGFIVDGNYIHDIGQTRHDHFCYFGCPGTAVRRNLMTNAEGDGMEAWSAKAGIPVTHNIIGGCRNWGACMGGPDGLVAHNVFLSNSWAGVMLFRKGCTNVRVVNNVILQAKGSPVVYDNLGGKAEANPTGNLVDYNCFGVGLKLANPLPGNTHGEHNIYADAGFVDAAKLDFRLKPDSPCLGAGMRLKGEDGKAPNIGLYP